MKQQVTGTEASTNFCTIHGSSDSNTNINFLPIACRKSWPRQNVPIYECVGASAGVPAHRDRENVSFGVGYRMVCGDDIPIMCIPDNSYFSRTKVYKFWGVAFYQRIWHLTSLFYWRPHFHWHLTSPFYWRPHFHPELNYNTVYLVRGGNGAANTMSPNMV